ncbi:MAG: hypothetical protein BMS9Abin37_0711 [Acidobacteriota bacterium]|nr:MAG: hypothetical protein BMS9Abin37_0711 [Acidobacteriota bacterium]
MAARFEARDDDACDWEIEPGPAQVESNNLVHAGTRENIQQTANVFVEGITVPTGRVLETARRPTRREIAGDAVEDVRTLRDLVGGPGHVVSGAGDRSEAALHRLRERAREAGPYS